MLQRALLRRAARVPLSRLPAATSLAAIPSSIHGVSKFFSAARLQKSSWWGGQSRDWDYFHDTSDSQQLLDLLEGYKLQRWGFVVYRCTYHDDKAWQAFMDRIQEHVSQYFTMDITNEEPQLVIDRFQCIVQQDPTLQDATKAEARRRFKTWIDNQSKQELAHVTDGMELRMLLYHIPRYSYCIHVDEHSLASVLEGGEKDAYVNFIRADESWYYNDFPEFDTFDWSKHVEPEDEDKRLDNNYPEIEGCRLWGRWMDEASVPLHRASLH